MALLRSPVIYCTVFSAELLLLLEVPACTVIRCRVFMLSYVCVKLGGVESVSTRTTMTQLFSIFANSTIFIFFKLCSGFISLLSICEKMKTKMLELFR